MSTLLRQHAEQQFAEELHELKKNETNSVPLVETVLVEMVIPLRVFLQQSTHACLLMMMARHMFSHPVRAGVGCRI